MRNKINIRCVGVFVRVCIQKKFGCFEGQKLINNNEKFLLSRRREMEGDTTLYRWRYDITFCNQHICY
jgi:hypothetical protein